MVFTKHLSRPVFIVARTSVYANSLSSEFSQLNRSPNRKIVNYNTIIMHVLSLFYNSCGVVFVVSPVSGIADTFCFLVSSTYIIAIINKKKCYNCIVNVVIIVATVVGVFAIIVLPLDSTQSPEIGDQYLFLCTCTSAFQYRQVKRLTKSNSITSRSPALIIADNVKYVRFRANSTVVTPNRTDQRDHSPSII